MVQFAITPKQDTRSMRTQSRRVSKAGAYTSSGVGECASQLKTLVLAREAIVVNTNHASRQPKMSHQKGQPQPLRERDYMYMCSLAHLEEIRAN